MVSVFSYSKTCNLGDAIQTLALSRLLNDFVGYEDRDNPSAAKSSEIHLANGYLDKRWRASSAAHTIFAGVHLADDRSLEALLSMNIYGFVGARDPWTHRLMVGNGVNSRMIGCATLTLPPYEGPRSGIYAVDMPQGEHPGEATRLTHFISPGMSWPEQLALARTYLECYRTAEAVFSTRLHVALPCLAFGTPVLLKACSRADVWSSRRLSLAEELAVPFGRVSNVPVREQAVRFQVFLAEAVQSLRHIATSRAFSSITVNPSGS